jgi:hypothetical protein
MAACHLTGLSYLLESAVAHSCKEWEGQSDGFAKVGDGEFKWKLPACAAFCWATGQRGKSVHQCISSPTPR